MIKTTEELKREMYGRLKSFQKAFTIGNFMPKEFTSLEDSLEAYLEALRQEAGTLREERDQLRNKLQAFEFANKSAGDLLREAMTLNKQQREAIKRQRQSIGQIKQDRNAAQRLAVTRTQQRDEARKELQEARQIIGSTIAQNRRESASGEELKRFAGHCDRCNGLRFERNASGALTGPCYKCGDRIGVLTP